MLATEAGSLDLILSVGKAAALGALEVTGAGGGGGHTGHMGGQAHGCHSGLFSPSAWSGLSAQCLALGLHSKRGVNTICAARPCVLRRTPMGTEAQGREAERVMIRTRTGRDSSSQRGALPPCLVHGLSRA